MHHNDSEENRGPTGGLISHYTKSFYYMRMAQFFFTTGDINYYSYIFSKLKVFKCLLQWNKNTVSIVLRKNGIVQMFELSG